MNTMRNRLAAGSISLLAGLVLVLQGCAATPPRVTPSATPTVTLPWCTVAPSLAATATSELSLSVDSPAFSTASPTTSVSSTPAPTGTPKPMLYSTKGFITNPFTASDGKNIYYFANNGIHCMNQNGSGDKQTCIKDGELFLSYNTHGLFYTSYDSTYKMTKAERESDYDLSSRNLMVYNPVTNASTMIQKHIYDAVALGSKIYMIDHLKHFHILCYDMSKGTLTDVKGFPSEYRHATVINLSLDDDGVEVQCSNSATDEDGNEGTDGWDVYLIDGNRIITDGGYPEDTESPQDSDETDTPTDGYTYDVDYSTYYDLDNGAKFRLDGNNMLAILTGTYYEDLDIPSVYDATIVGSKLYVLSSSYAEAILDVDDDAGYPYAVYSVSPSGSIQKLAEGTDMTPENPLNNMVCEAVGNWYFVYWTNDSCSYFSSLLIKLKTE